MSKASEEKAAEKKRRQGIQDEKEDDKKDEIFLIKNLIYKDEKGEIIKLPC